MIKKFQSKPESSRVARGRSASLIAELVQIEDRWLADRAAGDAESSRVLLAENFVGCDSAGLVEDKDTLLAKVTATGSSPKGTEHFDRQIRRFDNTVVSNGTARVTWPGGEHRYRYLRVFTWTTDGWRLVASQATKLCASSDAPA